MRRFRIFDLADKFGKRLFTGYQYAEAVAEQAWIRRSCGQFLRIVPHNK